MTSKENMTSKQTRKFDLEVGDGVTISGWSDSDVYTVVSVSKSGNSAVVREDKSTLLNGVNSGEPDALKFYPGGFAGHTTGTQRWRHEPDPDGQDLAVASDAPPESPSSRS